MQKPEGWDVAPAKTCDHSEPSAGGYIFKIMGVKAIDENGIQKLQVKFDIAEGEFADYYNTLSAESPIDRLIKKQFSSEYMGYWKGFTTSIERSNAGYVWEFDEKTLLFKIVGGSLRYTEYRTVGGVVTTVPMIEHCCSVDTVRQGKVKPLPLRKLAPTKPERGVK